MIGNKLGSYELLEEIGRGGMATVYRARQISVERDVAIKVIKHNIKEDPDAIQRFQREARVIARLEHPHILPIYDFDGTHEPPYIVMRYLDGGTLKDVMKQGLLPLSEIAYLIQQVASALDYAHRQGIVHRDIKPSNIMIDQEGNAFVSDLGIARITGGADGERKGITMSGAIIGTPEYMSPEQAMGRADVDYRADIYSLGAMLFEMLTGQLPFDADTSMGILLKHIQNPIPSACLLNTDLPLEVDYIIQKALAKEPEERYSSSGEMVREFIHMSGSTLTIAPVRLRAAAAESMTMRAVKEQSAQSDQPVSDVSTGSKSTPKELQRQMTVLHLNAAGFEELLLETNPEDASATLNKLLNAVQKIAEQNGAFIRERTATTLQGLWGVQEVRENDPETAIHTALAMRDTCQKMTAQWLEGEAMPIQIGIDTGAVLIQEDANGLQTSGQPITLVTRIERAAPEGSILISYETFRHVIGIFDVLAETPVRVRGRTEPLEVYVIQRARPRAFRLQTRGVEGIETKMVGRDGELKLLQDALMLCIEDSETQMVTVTADAGVGKSRLLFEFSRWIDVIDQTIIFFEGRATPQTTNLPYSLIRSVFSFRFEILDSDSPEVMRDKLTQGISGFLGGDSAEATAFIGQLVGFDFSDHPAVQPVLTSPETFQRRALEHLNAFFCSIPNKNPAIIELEDIHWADTYSLDLIDNLVKSNRELPLMVICMARPELNEHRPGWGEGQEFHHRLDLKPLSKLDTRRLVREVLQKVDDIPSEIRDLIVERADGNPFYVEELVKILIEDGVIVKGASEGDNWRVLPERLADLRVPPTLTGVLQARLDTLDPMARLLLGRASVVGRIFWTSAVDALESADGFHIEQKERLLEDLRNREMIYLREKSDFANTQEYVIKHAILRDVIYDSLLKRQQRAYHAATAEWLIRASAERADEYTGLIAEHYEKAGESTQAALYLLRIAKQANQISAFVEAKTSLTHALTLLTGDDDATQGVLLDVQMLLGEIYDTIGDYNAAFELLEPALALARHRQENAKTADILAMLARIIGMRRGDKPLAEQYLEEAEALARGANALPELVIVLRQWGNILQGYISDPDKQKLALQALEESLSIAQTLGDESAVARTWNSIGNTHAGLMQFDEALFAFDQCIAIGQRLGDVNIIAFALGNKALVFFDRKEYEPAIQCTVEAMGISEKIGAEPIGQYSNLAMFYALTDRPFELVEKYAQITLQSGLQQQITYRVLNVMQTYSLLYEREGIHLITALEFIGANLAGDNFAPMDIENLLNPMLERIRQQLPEAEIQAALERGKTLDVMAVGRSLLK